jgi:hypothetical protein
MIIVLFMITVPLTLMAASDENDLPSSSGPSSPRVLICSGPEFQMDIWDLGRSALNAVGE